MPSKSAFFLLLGSVLLVSIGCTKRAASPLLWGRLTAGSYDVGIRSISYVDSSRVGQLSPQPVGHRPIEVVVWYPVSDTPNQNRLKFSDYLTFLPQFQKSSHPDSLRDWLSLAVSGSAQALGRDTLDVVLSSRMQARRNAQPSAGEFPLVLWTMRHETIVSQSVLCEFLASHGYVVASARYGGTGLPFPWDLETAEEKLSTFDTHLKDMEFALKSIMREPHVDSSRVGIVTWSYAAEMAPRVQMQNTNVKIVIGLSSNPLSESGLYQGTSAASHLAINRLNATYVVMTEKLGFDGKERTPPGILSQLSSDSYYVSFAELAHGNFNTLEGMIPGILDISKVQPWSIGGNVAQIGYESISRGVLSFLDHYLKTEPELNRIWQTDLPQGFVSIKEYEAM